MYAIIKSGGKQYRVERGQTLLVERLAADEGASVALEPVLYRSEDVVFDAASLKKVKVAAKVIGHERGEKLRVFKFKPKRGYKRRTGHRQELTRIEVTDISMGTATKTAAKSASKPVAARAPAAKAAGEKAGKIEAVAKPPARKTTRKPAAKKPSTANDDPAAAAGGGEVQEVPSGS